MKHKLYKFILTLCVLSLSSVSGMARVTAGDADFGIPEDADFIPAMIMVDDDDIAGEIESLKSRGVQVLRNRGNILLTLFPVNYDFSTLRRSRGVRKFEVKPRFNRPAMDKAREFNNAYYINEGFDIPQSFNGKGVVIGVCDIGMDTRHVNFLSEDGSECRIRRVVHYQELQGKRDVYATPEEIYNWQTDNVEEWHATHVTGIAAGAYSPNGLQSLAPAADIVFSASQLSDVGLLAGVEDIIDYAKEVGKPAVINLSMGNNLGPHDGTSLFTQYLDRCADDAIICISAGNDGLPEANSGVSLSYNFTNPSKDLTVLTTNWNGFHNYGEAQVWSADDTPVDFTIEFFNEVAGESNVVVKSFHFDEGNPSLEYRFSADPSDADYDELFASVYNEGEIQVKAGVNALNNRFNITVDLDCYTDINSPASPKWSKYWPGIRLSAPVGTHVDIFGGGDIFLRKCGSDPAPDNKMSISDLATGYRTITVGMTNNRSQETYINGVVEDTGYPEGQVCQRSSYGTLLDGRVMPMTCAPGAIVISSISSPFLANYPGSEVYTNAIAEIDGQKYYWASNVGTSMSTPYVVSAIASWVQAKPNLTAEEAQELVRQTNSSDYPDSSNPRHGQGWFNPYAGLVKIFEDTGSTGVPAPEINGVDMKLSFGSLCVSNFGNPGAKLSIVNVNAVAVLSVEVPEGLSSFDLSSLSSGVYLAVFENRHGLRKITKLLIP